jgi:CubicO group peptidase (beta-lactamase class C family)
MPGILADQPYPHQMKTTKLLIFLSIVSLVTMRCDDQPSRVTDWEFNDLWYMDGWDIRKKNDFQRYIIDSTQLTGLVIVHKGKLVHAYGDIWDNSYIASCRKSVLAMIYGEYVLNGRIDLGKTLGEMGIDDVTILLPAEKKARIRDLITARSGVFLNGSNAGDFREFAPERGSVKPGEYWLYSNWDFNLAGFIFEEETGKNIYDEVERQLAIPLGMQDWDRSLQRKSGDTTVSRYLAYHMWFSTRDMARIGQLMLNRGKWNGKQIIAEEWIRRITTKITSAEDVKKNVPIMAEMKYDQGYGYMWWLWENVPNPNMEGAYSAFGAWGQGITVYPRMDVVLAYKTNSIYRRSNRKERLNELIVKVAAMYDAEMGAVKGKLYDSFRGKPLNEAKRDFHEAREKNPDMDLELFMDCLGCEFLGQTDYSRALAVFKLNAEAYPQSWNAYKSLAEGYEQSGDTRNAMKCYERCLEINPGNGHTRERLRNLRSKHLTV